MESEILLSEQLSGSHSDPLQTKNPKGLEILNTVKMKKKKKEVMINITVTNK